MIIFQVWLSKIIFKVAITKTKSSQREINKKKKTLKRSVFRDLSFIRSLCKVFGALGFSYITFFIYAPKLSKSYFILNLLKLDYFMFQLKPCVKWFPNLFTRFLVKKNGYWAKNGSTSWIGWGTDRPVQLNQ